MEDDRQYEPNDDGNSVVPVTSDKAQASPAELVANKIVPVRLEYVIPNSDQTMLERLPTLHPIGDDDDAVVKRARRDDDAMRAADVRAGRDIGNSKLSELLKLIDVSEGKAYGNTNAVQTAAQAATSSLNDKLRIDSDFCYLAARFGKCDMPGCPRNHNISEYLNKRVPDLDGTCPRYRAVGYCRYGVMCRFSHDHVTASNYPEFKNEGNPDKLDPAGVINAMEKDEIIALRKLGVAVTKPKPKPTGLGDAEPKRLDVKGKLVLASLTTVGNLPYRRLCVESGADVTMSEMAMADNIIKGVPMDCQLLRRHESEKYYGIQLSGAQPKFMAAAASYINEHMSCDFIDLNCACPMEVLVNKGMGAALCERSNKVKEIVSAISQVTDIPITLKLRTGKLDGKPTIHKWVHTAKAWGVQGVFIHGRTYTQRYVKDADWNYLASLAESCSTSENGPEVIGAGDIYTYDMYLDDITLAPKMSGVMIARGALVKPWIFTEIKERRHWDISSRERWEMMTRFTSYGLDFWGSDAKGVEATRHFLLEWQSFAHRYVPVGILERLDDYALPPQRLNFRPPAFKGRDELETMLGSANPHDWVSLSERLLGPGT